MVITVDIMNETVFCLSIAELYGVAQQFLNDHCHSPKQDAFEIMADRELVATDAINLAISALLFQHDNFYKLFELTLTECGFNVPIQERYELQQRLFYEVQKLISVINDARPASLSRGFKYKTFHINLKSKMVAIVVTIDRVNSMSNYRDAIMESINNGDYVPTRIRKLLHADVQ